MLEETNKILMEEMKNLVKVNQDFLKTLIMKEDYNSGTIFNQIVLNLFVKSNRLRPCLSYHLMGAFSTPGILFFSFSL